MAFHFGGGKGGRYRRCPRHHAAFFAKGCLGPYVVNSDMSMRCVAKKRFLRHEVADAAYRVMRDSAPGAGCGVVRLAGKQPPDNVPAWAMERAASGTIMPLGKLAVSRCGIHICVYMLGVCGSYVLGVAVACKSGRALG